MVCQPDEAATLREAIHSLEGVYSVHLYPAQGKLAIRFSSTLCTARQIMQQLRQTVNAIQNRPLSLVVLKVYAASSSQQSVVMRPMAFLSLWIKAKWKEFRETLQAGWIVIKRAYHASGFATGEQPRWLKDFMNDLLMLFLIKIHWHQLLTEWLPRPWTYRYEWAATLYLVYLSVQAKAQRIA